MHTTPPILKEGQSSSSLTPTIGMNVPCGHCFHVSCYQRWDFMNVEQDKKTCCPTCKTRTQFLIRLRTGSCNVSKTKIESASDDAVEFPQDPSCSAVCLPCGHVFSGYHQEWRNWVDTTIQRKKQKQGLQSYSKPHSQSHRRLGQCPLCNASVACAMRLYTNIPSKNPISMLNHRDYDSFAPSSSLPSPIVSSLSGVLSKSYSADTTIIPNRILVTGAGTAVVNGVYTWNGRYDHDSNRYIRYGEWNNMLCIFNIYRCHTVTGEEYWFVSIVTDFDMEGTDTDIDFYRAPIVALYPSVPPRDGWSVYGTTMKGCAPYPRLSYQHYDAITGDVQELLKLPHDMDAIESNEMSVPPAFGRHVIVIEGAGQPAVNGTYVEDGLFQNAKRYVRNGLWNNEQHHFNILLCYESSSNWHWYISIVPHGANPGTRSDIDFYTVQMSESSIFIPPSTGWTTRSEGKDPAPRLIHRDVSILPTLQESLRESRRGYVFRRLPPWMSS